LTEGGRFCGNCDIHVCYEYPLRVFCSSRYERGEDPVVDTLWCCGDWVLEGQECHCVEEALRLRDKVGAQR
jgi:hypothetical protein